MYTGEGKGKTTAMLGLALRASGAGLRVYIGQFLKDGEYSEIKALRNLPEVFAEQYGEGFTIGKPSCMDKAAAKAGLDKAKAAMLSERFDVIMLDEINVALLLGLLTLDEVLDMLGQKPQSVELVLTGRAAPDEIIEAADLVSEIKEIKHYYNAGVPARDGIEQ